MEEEKLDLVEVIKANPGCVAIVDNDSWTLYREDPYSGGPDEDKDYDAFVEWERGNKLADDRSVTPRGAGYGSGNCYGGDLLQALAEIVGVEIESV